MLSNEINSLRIEFFGRVTGFDIEDMPHFIEDFFKDCGSSLNPETMQIDLHFAIVDSDDAEAVAALSSKYSLTRQQVTNEKNTLYHYFPNGERCSSSLRCIPVMGC